MERTIFVVDDSRLHLTVAESVLKEHYNVVPMQSAKVMFAFLEQMQPHLILLDIEMPDMDGFEVLQRLKANPNYDLIPVVFLTGMQNPEVEARGFEMGVVDFIQKPFSPPVLFNRVKLQINVAEIIRERTARLRQIQKNLVHILSDVMESRDEGTGIHIERTAKYIEILVKGMIERDVYAEELKNWDIEMLHTFALLHDLGKIAVSDLVLNKPGKLTEAEYEEMKKHAPAGEVLLNRVIKRTNDDSFLRHVKLFAAYHHEKWDGSGYPYGLKEMEIPLEGRIMAVADVFDALTSERPYKKAFTPQKAAEIIKEGVGKHFDPQIADVFFDMRNQFEEAYERLIEKRRKEM